MGVVSKGPRGARRRHLKSSGRWGESTTSLQEGISLTLHTSSPRRLPPPQRTALLLLGEMMRPAWLHGNINQHSKCHPHAPPGRRKLKGPKGQPQACGGRFHGPGRARAKGAVVGCRRRRPGRSKCDASRRGALGPPGGRPAVRTSLIDSRTHPKGCQGGGCCRVRFRGRFDRAPIDWNSSSGSFSCPSEWPPGCGSAYVLAGSSFTRLHPARLLQQRPQRTRLNERPLAAPPVAGGASKAANPNRRRGLPSVAWAAAKAQDERLGQTTIGTRPSIYSKNVLVRTTPY